MNDEQLLRYSRHVLLPNFGVEAQAQLTQARVLIIGLGGLGSPIALYLAAAGVGELILADGDCVELSNLQRQIIHHTATLGQLKVESAAQQIWLLNPDVQLTLIPAHLDAPQLNTLIAGVDLVMDASDNFTTRFAINRACYAAAVPLVSGAIIRYEGQVTAFNGQPGGPCYQCLYSEDPAVDLIDNTCTANGVFAPAVGVIGSLQASEAIKILTGIGAPLYGQLLLFDALHTEWRRVRLIADPACPICQAR
ncbi:molybdopterin-synthase adenylyltransferase MoeB [Rhodoferax sp. 4810]|uniref:Molybdopterin-synthase adenylyltransferase n=1 Tax=Thiospirillum jenense TaxID=1653858 RepID=A0A839H8I4_9GAMM|nr:molybdopterin-synthase adenylyltransferase MoeB [Thiospirillum jenense]MBB1073371.1 molybdopterin-synthase adenylyltransferase MoeB [Rhodoferax jenense]MBB1125723.1 molybdopterin-synthase adenylyltransferase MoeB [Thiospirillum jenense]